MFYFLVIIQLTFTSFSLVALQALNHPYFFALPYPTYPSKLPKTAAQTAASSRPLDEVDGNVDPSGGGPADKAAGSKKLKRKLSGSDLSRNIARKLDFTAAAASWESVRFTSFFAFAQRAYTWSLVCGDRKHCAA
jgi:hypothetical protein